MNKKHGIVVAVIHRPKHNYLVHYKDIQDASCVHMSFGFIIFLTHWINSWCAFNVFAECDFSYTVICLIEVVENSALLAL